MIKRFFDRVGRLLATLFLSVAFQFLSHLMGWTNEDSFVQVVSNALTIWAVFTMLYFSLNVIANDTLATLVVYVGGGVIYWIVLIALSLPTPLTIWLWLLALPYAFLANAANKEEDKNPIKVC